MTTHTKQQKMTTQYKSQYNKVIGHQRYVLIWYRLYIH